MAQMMLGLKMSESLRLTRFINARVIDPASGFDGHGEVLMQNGIILEMGTQVGGTDCAIVDCDGHALMPGIIDLHVSTGEPGEEHRETLKSAGQAAALHRSMHVVARCWARS